MEGEEKKEEEEKKKEEEKKEMEEQAQLARLNMCHWSILLPGRH